MRTTDLNRINNTMATELAAKQEAERLAAERALIEEAQPKDILNMIDEVYNKTLLIISDDNGDIIGINCPKAVKGITNTKKIGGHMVMGSDENNLKEDEIELKKFMKSYQNNPASIMQMFNVALLITTAGLHPNYAEYINGKYYFVINSLKKVIDEDGNTIVDVNSQIPGEINDKLLTEILKDKLHLVK